MKRSKEPNGPAKTKKPRKAPAASGHKLAAPMPEGSVLTDLTKAQWKLGKAIGCGGFGLIYLTQQNSSSPVRDDAEFVMKLEPHDNGPLFCELHFYQRAAKPDMIKDWMTKHSLKSLGVPKFIASGQHERDGVKYRFMVMQRFGTDLQKLFEANGKRFPVQTVFLLGLKLIDVLEYIHESGYVHADIKASNLVTGFKDPHQVYLIDYGLAFRYIPDGKHKDYKEDPRKAHDGTVEFTSRDAHKGATPSRRGDLEILGYCLVQWLCQRLPWEDKLNNKDYVRDQKIRYMSDIPSFLGTCLAGQSYPAELSTYLTYVSKLKYDETPSYAHCRQLFSQALKKLGFKESDKLEFSVKSSGVAQPSPARGQRKRTAASIEDNVHAAPAAGAAAHSRWGSGSPTIDEEASQPPAKVRKGRRSKSSETVPTVKKKSAGPLKLQSPVGSPLMRKPVPAGPRKKLSSGQSPLAAARASAKSPAGSSKSPAARGGLQGVAASRARIAKAMSSAATQTSPGLRGLPRSRRGR